MLIWPAPHRASEPFDSPDVSLDTLLSVASVEMSVQIATADEINREIEPK